MKPSRSWLWLALLAVGLGACRGRPACDLADSLTAAQCSALRALVLPTAQPAARGNRYADDPNAAFLGFQVFFDARFSAGSDMRCASCHMPERHFQDSLSRPPVGQVFRKTPSMLNTSRLHFMFWDGRADSVWSQPLKPLESHAEMSVSRLQVAHQLASSWGPEYEKVFGALPPLSDTSRFPAAGAPGDPAWDQMAAADQEAVNRVMANLGKAFEAYLRKLAGGRAPFDRYLLGDPSALTSTQRRGLGVFVRAGCLQCHSGPMLTDESFHNLGIPASPGTSPDPGRAAGVALLAADPFNLKGPFSDDPSSLANPADYQGHIGDLGAFKTPSLRNVTLSAPYSHTGGFASLAQVIDFHLAGGGTTAGAPPGSYVGIVDPLLVRQELSQQDRDALVAFLSSLEGDYPPLPWANWPQR